VPPVQDFPLVQVGATANGSGPGVPPSAGGVVVTDAQPVVGYPAEIQFCKAAISADVAGGYPAGGIGAGVLIIRDTATTAMVLVGSEIAGAVIWA
jgi:hypothetical protein